MRPCLKRPDKNHVTSKIKSPRFLVATGLVSLIIAHFLLSWIMARSPFLAEVIMMRPLPGKWPSIF